MNAASKRNLDILESDGVPRVVRILVLEDVLTDAEMELRTIKAAGVPFVSAIVDRREAFLDALESFRPDIVVSDYSLPQFTGMEALKLLQERMPLVPLVIVTGSINEETAAECIKAGAADYVLKERIGRLGHAVRAALDGAREHCKRMEAEVGLRLRDSALMAAANGVVITEQDGTIVWVNPAFTELTGWTLEEAAGQTPRILKSGRQRPQFYQQMWETITAGLVWRGELYNRKKDGSLHLEEMTITPVRTKGAEITHFVAVKEDLSTKTRLEREVQRLSSEDPLTGLPTRQVFSPILHAAVERARSGASSALLLLDVDSFRVVNDVEGHTAGDHVIAAFADALSSRMRPEDVMARVSGDGFAVLVSSASPPLALEIAEELRTAVEEMRFTVGQDPFTFTLSGGLCQIDGTIDAEAVMALADRALHEAKELGRNRIVVSAKPDPSKPRSGGSGIWGTRVKDAMKEERLVLFYQPIVDLRSGVHSHHEVLIRMKDRDGKLVPPGLFLPAAERFGLMPRVDGYVLARALVALAANPRINLFVNVSGSSLGDERLLAEIGESVAAAALPPGRLGFEITETAAVADLGWVRRWVTQLKELGCLFALDDFGTGFSSFDYLRSLPVDFVKLDGSYVRDLDTDATSRVLVTAITTAAHALGKEVIAEQVERASVAELLQKLGVEYGQGYHWGRPEPEPVELVN
jgi:diguanylate cyclase (GGDEF)-like protein/PAS domain S-box-containing protein